MKDPEIAIIPAGELSEAAKREITRHAAQQGINAEVISIDEAAGFKKESEEEKNERLQKAIDAAVEDAQVRGAVIDKLMAPTRKLYSHLKNAPQKKHVHDPQVAAMIREITQMRRKYFRMRRLPKGHPDKITGPIPEMEN